LNFINHLRNGMTFNSVEECKAVFLTPSYVLVKIAKAYLYDVEKKRGVPYAVTETAMANFCWLKSGGKFGDIPQKMMLATCSAAITPSPAVWEKFQEIVKEIPLDHMKHVSPEELLTAIRGKEYLAVFTDNNPSQVNKATALEIIDLLENEKNLAVEQARAVVTNEKDREIAAIEGKLRSSEAEIKLIVDKQKKLAQRDAKVVQWIFGSFLILCGLALTVASALASAGGIAPYIVGTLYVAGIIGEWKGWRMLGIMKRTHDIVYKMRMQRRLKAVGVLDKINFQ
jgi:hypothetical protein